MLLAGVLVGAVAAQSGPTLLTSPTVAPRTGTPTTPITFTVQWQNHEGSAPDHVDVVIDGATHAMSVSSGGPKGGALYTYTTTLSVGTHSVTFQAADTRKFSTTLDGGTVAITAPPPPPTGGGSTGGSTGGTGSAPGGPAAPATGGGSNASGSGSGPTAVPASGGTASGAPAPGGSAGGAATGDDLPMGGGAFYVATYPPSGSVAGTTGSLPGAGGGAARREDGSPSRQGPGRGGEALAVTVATALAGTVGAPDDRPGAYDGTAAVFALDDRRSLLLRALPLFLATTGGMVMAFAFLFFGKRRRDGEQPAPDETLAAAAASGLAGIGSAGLVPATAPVFVDEEASLPRWRRPSLMAARKSDPLRDAAVQVNLTFDHGLVGPVEGFERRRIRYRLVHLLDGPDELRSTEIGLLDEGDEVQLLEKQGTYWLVLTPDGRQGWLHQMTLGEVVAADADRAPETEVAERGVVDEDVLAAYLRARASA